MTDSTRVYDPKSKPKKVQFPLELVEDFRARMEAKGWIAVALTMGYEVLRMRQLHDWPSKEDDDGSDPTFTAMPPIVIYRRAEGDLGSINPASREIVAKYLEDRS